MRLYNRRLVIYGANGYSIATNVRLICVHVYDRIPLHYHFHCADDKLMIHEVYWSPFLTNTSPSRHCNWNRTMPWYMSTLIQYFNCLVVNESYRTLSCSLTSFKGHCFLLVEALEFIMAEAEALEIAMT
jgi:hypothetical protein